MFYCEPCRKKNDWPESIGGSYGPCECCGKVANCFDTPSSHLPLPKVKKKDKQTNRRSK